MGNNCVHGKIDENGALYCLFWPSKRREDNTAVTQKPMKIKEEAVTTTPQSPKKVVIDEHGALYGLFWPSKPREDNAAVTKKPIKIEAEAVTTTPPSPKKVMIDVKQTEQKVFMIVTEQPKPREDNAAVTHKQIKIEDESVTTTPPSPKKVKPVMIDAKQTEQKVFMIVTEKQKPPHKKPNAVKRKMRIGLEVDSVLKTKTGHLKQRFDLGDKLGHGQFGTTFLCTERKTGNKFACKSIAKRKLVQKEDLEDVRREVEILHHLSGHENVVSIQGAYEDAVAVHVVMELCGGGELFDRIAKRGHYSEKKAAELTRTIVGVLEACHSLGVMHRDVKPENFLFVNGAEDSAMKIIDFGLSAFFKPGQVLSDLVGSPYYIAPEVLCKRYGAEADLWSAGVIVYILLCGVPPFWGETKQDIFKEVLYGEIDFSSHPWPNISESAKDLVKRMLVRDPTKRITAHQILSHPWVQVDGIAPDEPIHSAVLSRMMHFSAMNKLKKMAIRVIAESLSEEEIAGLRKMFETIDSDNNGYITFEELKVGLTRYGANLEESEIHSLLRAADIDNNGAIEYGEFIAATLHMNKIDKDDHLIRAFSYFDKDGSGYITQDELQRACEDFGIQDFKLDEIIQEADQDNDGRIDYNEFVAMMHRGNTDFSNKKFTNNFGVGFKEAMPVC